MNLSFTSEQIGRDITFSDEDNLDTGDNEELPLDEANYEQVKVYSTNVLNTHIILSSINTVTVTQISCSDNHTLIQTNTGSVYGWGSNNYSQLGFECNSEQK